MFLKTNSFSFFKSIFSLTSNCGQLSACFSKGCVLLDPSTLETELDFHQKTNSNPFRCIPTYGGYFCAEDFDIKIFTAGLNPRKITQATFSHRINNVSLSRHYSIQESSNFS